MENEEIEKAVKFLENFLDENTNKIISQHFKEIIGLIIVQYNQKLISRINELQRMNEIIKLNPQDQH